MDCLARGSPKIFLKQKHSRAWESPIYGHLCRSNNHSCHIHRTKSKYITTHYPLPTNNIVMSICKEKQDIYNNTYYALKSFKMDMKHDHTHSLDTMRISIYSR